MADTIDLHVIDAPSRNAPLSQALLRCHEPEHGYVYIVQAGGHRRPVKVGHAKSVRGRLRDLQISNHAELVLLMAIECNNAPRLERDIHAVLADSRLRGEWFAWSRVLEKVLTLLRRGFHPHALWSTFDDRRHLRAAAKLEMRVAYDLVQDGVDGITRPVP